MTVLGSAVPNIDTDLNKTESKYLQKVNNDYDVFHDDMVKYLSSFDDENTGSLERRKTPKEDLNDTWNCAKKRGKLIWAPAVASCTVICLA